MRMVRVIWIGALAALAGAAPTGAEGPPGLQEVLLRAKPGVALIVTDVSAEVTVNCGAGEVTATKPVYNSTGTGWFIGPDGFVITNAHVVQQAHAPGPDLVASFSRRATEAVCLPTLLARLPAGGDRRVAEEAVRRRIQDTIAPTARVKLLPQVSVVLSNGTRQAAEVRKYTPPVVVEASQKPGRDLALLKVAGHDYPVLPVADAKAVQIGDPIHILGFPGVVLSHELLNQQSARMEASVTNGAVSGFKEDVAKQPVLQTDAPAAWGNSGGPAVNARGEVIGVLTFVSLAPGAEGGIVQGFNFIVPADAVREFVRDTEARPGAVSRFNEAWWAGLRAFFSDDFGGAERRFQEANKLHADLPDVRRVLAEAQEKIKHPPPRPFPWAWLTLGITLASAGGYGGLWARRWWRNRYRIAPAQIVGMVQGGAKPLFLDVRTPEDYEASPLRIPGGVRILVEEVEAGRGDLPSDTAQPIVTYCGSLHEETSARAAAALRQRGYHNVRILKDGLGGWANAGLPVEAKSNLPAIGVEIYKHLAAGALPRRHLTAGQVVFKEGEDAHGEAFVIHSGKIDIRKLVGGGDQVIRTLGEGELLGELALIREVPRSASAVAATDAELLVIGRSQLDWLIRNRPEITLEIIKRLSIWLAGAMEAMKPQEQAAGGHPPQPGR